MKRLSLFLLPVLLVLAACEPPPPELDGAPSAPSASPAPADPLLPPGELAGGAPVTGLILPGTLNLAPPSTMQVITGCAPTIAPDYDRLPDMTCLLFEADGSIPPGVDQPILEMMNAAGWQYVRARGSERYFERPKPSSDCADVAALSVVGDFLAALVARAMAERDPRHAPSTNTSWRGYAIPHSIHEACGADRMRP